MLIPTFRNKLLINACCKLPSDGVLEIPNSVREKELKKVWVDCSAANDALLILLEEKKNQKLCPLFRPGAKHLKSCDGIILLQTDTGHHAVFCELKTSWDADAITQIRNSHLFFNYAHELVKAWHGAPHDDVTCWFSVITTGVLPVNKFTTRFHNTAIPQTHKPSKLVDEPFRLRLIDGKGQSPRNPLKINELAHI